MLFLVLELAEAFSQRICPREQGKVVVEVLFGAHEAGPELRVVQIEEAVDLPSVTQMDVHSESVHREPQGTVLVPEDGQVESAELVVHGHLHRVQPLIVVAEQGIVASQNEVGPFVYSRLTLEIKEAFDFLVQGKQNTRLAPFVGIQIEKQVAWVKLGPDEYCNLGWDFPAI